MPGAMRAVATPHRQELKTGQEDMIRPAAGHKEVLWTGDGQENAVWRFRPACTVYQLSASWVSGLEVMEYMCTQCTLQWLER